MANLDRTGKKRSFLRFCGGVIMNIFRQLAEGGGYTLPYLLHIYADNKNVDLYVINDNQDLEYNGHTYNASSFTYRPNSDTESSLEIELVDHDQIIDLLENNYAFKVEAIGVLYNGEVNEIRQFRHIYGEGSWTGSTLQLKLNKDDRLGMTFPALVFDTFNNRGNA